MASMMDTQLQLLLSLEFQNKRIDWKRTVHSLNFLRIFYSLWRGERWIKHIWLTLSHLQHLTWDHFLKSYSTKGVVYLLFNTTTKKMVVGSTSQSMFIRFRSHLTGRVDNISRRAANYITNLGTHQWIILPLEYVPSKQLLHKQEGLWARRFRDFLINNPIELTLSKPTKKPTAAKKLRDSLRIPLLKQTTYNWKSYIHLIRSTSIWKTWHELPLINLLLNIKRAKLQKHVTTHFTYIIRNHLAKAFKFRLRPFYQITVPPNTIDFGPRLQHFLKSLINRHYDYALASYIADHLRITMSSILPISKLIGNYKETLKDYCAELPSMNCGCHLFDTLAKTTDGHVCTTALDLPPDLEDLKQLLTIPANTPTILNYNTYLGICFTNIREFLVMNAIPINWNEHDNNKLYKIIQREKPNNPLLYYDYIKDTMEPWKTHLCFVPLDKNHNTWTIMCKHLYLMKHHEEFNNKKFYELSTLTSLQLKLRIRAEFDVSVKPLIPYLPRFPFKWDIGNAYLLPKFKDPTRSRPLISFAKHFVKPIARKVARALTLMIKELTLLWDTLDLSSPNKLKTRFTQAARGLSLEHGVTFLKFDIKNQFTNLSKPRILSTLLYALDTIRNRKTTRTLNFAIRNRAYENHYDHIGKPFRQKETGITCALILAYVKFELNFPFFHINDTVYLQKNGLPMGGFLSAPLACLDAMLQEHHYRHLLTTPIKFRFRDDILLCYACHLNQSKITDIHDHLNFIYRPDLCVELEDQSHTNIQFLEVDINSSMELSYFNKNLRPTHFMKLIRFPLATATLPKKIFIGTIIGTWTRITQICSTTHLQLLAIQHSLTEFVYQKYKYSWLAEAINYIKLPYLAKINIRNYLRSCCHLETLGHR